MPRNHTAAATTLRNRNRVTNKTRLKVVRGNIDADPLVLDEEEEKARVVSTAGVDAEDANEHHLQAVLSAASQRQHANAQRTSRGGNEQAKEEKQAYIPVPDSREVLEGYSDLYPPGRWTDPFNYIRSSDSVEESIKDAIANGFTYYMDERDQEWLEKNNEEARGEGTSAQGAVSSGGTTTRSGLGRGGKGKGKEPDVTSPVAMSEEEFELVMGIFEKVTHDKTEYLHHGLEQGMAFPPFSDYQETFATKLPASMFASFVVPEWVPEPAQLLRLAKVIYPYWRERRIERRGHRIIPSLNLDEADSKNESFICFRRRELKAVRKTRASQVSYSEKLVRLKSELALSLDLSGHVRTRELLKREAAQQAQQVWEKRLAFVELRTRFPSLAVKEDEELLFDKERVAKKAKTDGLSGRLPPSIKLRTRDTGELGSPSPLVEAAIKPRERAAAITKQIERDLAQLKEKDHHWEDGIDNPYQPPQVSLIQRHYKFATNSPSSPDDLGPPEYRAFRRRPGRGGRTWVERRIRTTRFGGSDNTMCDYTRYGPRFPDREVDEAEEQERAWRLTERWKYDADDDVPVYGPDGPEEYDRVLVDDYDPKYMRQAMSLLGEQDIQSLTNDPSLTITNSEGRQQTVIPFKLGVPMSLRRDPQRQHPMPPPHPSAMHPNGIPLTMPPGAAGAPVSLPTHLKMMQGPVRISSGVNLQRSMPTMPISQPNVPTLQSSPPHQTPSQPVNLSASGPIAASNAIADGNNSAVPNGHHGTTQYQPGQVDGSQLSDRPSSSASNGSPVRPSSQNQHPSVPVNGLHVPAVNGFPNLPNGSPYTHHSNLSPQQVEVIQKVFAPNVQPGQAFSLPVNPGNMQGRPAGVYVPNGANFNVPLSGSPINLNLPPKRQMQWANHHPHRPPSVNGQHGNGMDASQLINMNGSMSPPNQNINIPHSIPGVPGRVPSRGMVARPPSVVQGPQGNITHLTPHTSSPLLHNVNISSPQLHSSPPRQTHTPMTSPSMQHQQTQQMVGGAANGF